jgi:chemotaxis protein histidine kinase CheA/ActR/RegA family two-component response regulator
MSDPASRDPHDPAPPGAGSVRASAGDGSGGSSTPSGMSVATIRELFRIEARELLAGIGHKLAEIGDDPGDGRRLAEIAARGHALKGSAALAELPYLSRAGAILQRAAELAAEQAQRNRDAARNLVEATRAALEPAQRMLDDCLDGSPESQDRLFLLLLGAFPPEDRSELEARLRNDDAAQADTPDYEERSSAPEPGPSESALDRELPSAAGDDADQGIQTMLEATFLGELADLLDAVPDLLLAMVDPSRQADLCAELVRIFHTVKGSAATAGRDDLRELGKVLQDLFDTVLADPDGLPLRPDQVSAIEQPLAEMFLAAGIEPPAASLDVLRTASTASVLDDDGGPERDAAGVGMAIENVTTLTGETARDGEPEEESRTTESQEAMIEREIMEAFMLDAKSALDASETALLLLERNPKDQSQLGILFRQFHTLKGAAASVGLTRISEQLHAGETLLENIIDGAASHDPDALVELLLELVDSVAGLLAEARRVPHEHRILRDVSARIDEVLAHGVESAAGDRAIAPAADVAADEPGVSERTAEPSPTTKGREASAPGHGPASDPESAIVRVHASRLDLLMNRVSELVVSRTRMEDTMSAAHELRDKLTSGRLRLHEAIEGFRGFEFHPPSGGDQADPPVAGTTSRLGFSDLEFDKYDDFNLLARTLVELTADTGEIVEQLSTLIETLAEETRQVSKVTSSLQRTITGMRLLSLDTLFRRLQRPAREAARQVGKQVDLLCVGGEVQVDRALIESLYGPLLHLVRNSVSHGIEPLVERRASRKADIGLVEIRAVQRHGSVEITLRDDGRGLDFDAIYAKALHSGLLQAGAPPPPRADLATLIFRPGFSTRSQVTDLAGRGIGMDVVAEQVDQLRGSVSVESRDGKGALFRITLPLTAVIDQVLLLRAGSEMYGVSHGPIEAVLNVEPEGLVNDADGLRLRIGDDLLPAVPLTAIVGIASRRAPETAVVLRLAQQRLALLVDRIEAQREAVVRPLGRLFTGHPFITSATFSGDGQVVFVLDPGRLESWIAAGVPEPCEPAPTIGQAGTEGCAETDEISAQVLWADDSISVRRLAAHFLTAEGWTSRTAVDGRDALDKLRGGSFKLLVTDLEMPRMHGYELLHEIRADARLRDLPVIVCSSRSSEKHRRAAHEAGASGYLTKPFTREALATAVREMLGSGAG